MLTRFTHHKTANNTPECNISSLPKIHQPSYAVNKRATGTMMGKSDSAHQARGNASRHPGFRTGSFSGISVQQPPGGNSSIILGDSQPDSGRYTQSSSLNSSGTPSSQAESCSSRVSSQGSYMNGSHDGQASSMSRPTSFSGTRRLAPPGGFSTIGSIFNHEEAVNRNMQQVCCGCCKQ